MAQTITRKASSQSPWQYGIRIKIAQRPAWKPDPSIPLWARDEDVMSRTPAAELAS